VVQNLEGGVLQELHVDEGDRVSKGDPIATLNATIALSSVEELISERDAKRAKVTRLRAEVTGSDLAFSDPLAQRAPAIVSDERSLYRARQADLLSQIDTLTSRARQREQEIAELRDREEQLASRLALAREERDESAQLAKQNLVPRTEMLRLRREVARLEGELRTVRESIPRAQVAARQARQEIEKARLTFKRDAAETLTRTLLDLQVVEEQLTARRDKAQRRTVTAPVNGEIKEIHASTVGGAVKPGAKLAEIVPIGDSLLIEARVRPTEIAYIDEGQEALVKITAYDYADYGGLKGTVETVSADTLRTRKGESFYRIHLRTDEGVLTTNGRELPVIPGMTVEVEILGETKTVLDYLMGPFNRGDRTLDPALADRGAQPATVAGDR
jgi:adhesin transport system membrane fusion protein